MGRQFHPSRQFPSRRLPASRFRASLYPVIRASWRHRLPHSQHQCPARGGHLRRTALRQPHGDDPEALSPADRARQVAQVRTRRHQSPRSAGPPLQPHAPRQGQRPRPSQESPQGSPQERGRAPAEVGLAETAANTSPVDFPIPPVPLSVKDW